MSTISQVLASRLRVMRNRQGAQSTCAGGVSFVHLQRNVFFDEETRSPLSAEIAIECQCEMVYNHAQTLHRIKDTYSRKQQKLLCRERLR